MNIGLGMMRSFRPLTSSTLTMGLRLLVKLRKPGLPERQAHHAFVGQLGHQQLPERPAEQRVDLLGLRERERDVEQA